MTELSLFSGAGGGLLGTKLLGFRCVGYVESNEYCQKVLRARANDGVLDTAPIFSDVRRFCALLYRGRVDLVSAGLPCQPHSAAGKRRGAADERNLWPDTLRILHECEPAWFLLENSPRLITGGYFGTILGDLAEAGFDAEWDCVSAEEVGAEHRRERLWLLATHPDRAKLRKQSGRSRRQDRCDQALAALYGEDGDSSGPRARFAEPRVCRAADGMAYRMDRHHCIGNGQVPWTLIEAWRRLTED